MSATAKVLKFPTRKKRASGKGGSLRLFQSYPFRTKDPAIDEFRTQVEDHFGRRVNYKDLRKIEEGGGATVGCTSQWFFGKTMRPTNAAMEASGRTIGIKRVWVKIKK